MSIYSLSLSVSNLEIVSLDGLLLNGDTALYIVTLGSSLGLADLLLDRL